MNCYAAQRQKASSDRTYKNPVDQFWGKQQDTLNEMVRCASIYIYKLCDVMKEKKEKHLLLVSVVNEIYAPSVWFAAGLSPRTQQVYIRQSCS